MSVVEERAPDGSVRIGDVIGHDELRARPGGSPQRVTVSVPLIPWCSVQT
jgi:hypothetical protein